VKYDIPTTVLSLPPFHIGAVNISQKFSRQGIRSADHWHKEKSPNSFKIRLPCSYFKLKVFSELAMQPQKVAAVLILKLRAGWEWVVTARPRLLYPREQALTATIQEAWWASGPVWTGCAKKYYLCAPTGGRIPNRSIVASRCTDYAMSPLFPCMSPGFTHFLLFIDGRVVLKERCWRMVFFWWVVIILIIRLCINE